VIPDGLAYKEEKGVNNKLNPGPGESKNVNQQKIFETKNEKF